MNYQVITFNSIIKIFKTKIDINNNTLLLNYSINYNKIF